MKVVINNCFGGFSLSRKAVARLAELQGRPCYFFSHDLKDKERRPLDMNERAFMWTAYDVPNPSEVLPDQSGFFEMSQEERQASNAAYEAHTISNRPDNRADPLLVQVVNELGEAANGDHAKLLIVEIPDGVDWTIEEYDGAESVHERHRSWP